MATDYSYMVPQPSQYGYVDQSSESFSGGYWTIPTTPGGQPAATPTTNPELFTYTPQSVTNDVSSGGNYTFNQSSYDAQKAAQQSAYDQAMTTMGGWDIVNGTGDLSPYSFLGVMPAESRGGVQESAGGIAQQLGWTPQQFNDWSSNYLSQNGGTFQNDAGYNGAGAQTYAFLISQGYSPEIANQYALKDAQAFGSWERQQQDLNKDNGLNTFIPLLLGAVGGGMLMGGGLLGGASSTALGAGAGGVVDLSAMGGIAGGGFGSLGAGGAASGIGGALGGGLGMAGAGEGMVGWDALGNAASGGLGEVGSLAGTGMGGLDPSYFSDFGSNFGSTGQNMFAPTADSGLSGGGWTAADGSFGTSNSFMDQLKNLFQLQQQMPPGSSNLLKMLGGGTGTGGTGGAGGTGGTGTGGTGGMGSFTDWLSGTGAGSLGGLATGLMQYGEYGDQGDFLKNTMERAISASDPYGYGPYRKYAADQLQKTYTDPASIYGGAEMQALDKMFMDKTMAEQAASGNLFNAPERVAQRQNNFYGNLDKYRQPLMQMSGSQFRPDTKAYYEFAGPIVQNALNESASLGGAISSGIGGLSGLLGGMGGGSTGGTTGGLGDIWDLVSGGFGGGGYDYTNAASDIGNWFSGSDFYNSSDLLDLWL